jgi:hypothetical protein
MLHVPLRKVLALSTIFEAFTTNILHRLAPTFFPKLPDFSNSDLGHFPFPENMTGTGWEGPLVFISSSTGTSASINVESG